MLYFLKWLRFNKMNNDFEKLIKGKKVAIVGSASYMREKNYGQSIDDHDLVVRINRGCEIVKSNEEHIGSRTDILYSCLIEKSENAGFWNANMFVNDYKLKYLCTTPESSMAGISNFTSLHQMVDHRKYLDLSKKMPCRIVDASFFTKIAKEISCRPTTGYIAIYDILRYQPEKLSIHGFDFFYSGWYGNYKEGISSEVSDLLIKTLSSKRHKHKNMWQHAKNLLKVPNVAIDDHLKKVLEVEEWWFNPEEHKN